MRQEGNILYAEGDGMELQRKSDGVRYGKSVQLGKTWYINGERLAEPHEEVADDFEEVMELPPVKEDDMFGLHDED